MKKEFVVTHKKLNLMVGKKLQPMPFGKRITLDETVAKGLLARGFIKAFDKDEALDLESAKTEVKEEAKEETKKSAKAK